MSNYTDSLGLEEITPGDQAGLWGTTTNNNLALIDQAVTGVTPITEFNGVSGTTKTLTDFNGAADESRSAVLNITGTATGPNTVVVPNKQKTYLVRNNTGQNVVFQTAVPSATYTVESGNSILIFCDGNNNVYTGIEAPSTGTLGVSGGGTGVTTFTAGFVTSPGGTVDLSSVPYINMATDVTGVLPVANGGTGASTTAGAAFALKGANSDITSLTGLTTPLSVSRGGTGSTTLTDKGLVVGAGTAAVTSLVGGASGQVATWNGTAWTAATPSTAGITSVSGSSTVTASTVGTSVTVSQTSGQVAAALGYTPANSSSLASYALLSGASFTGAVNSTGSFITSGGGISCTVGGGNTSINPTSSTVASLQLGSAGAGVGRFNSTGDAINILINGQTWVFNLNGFCYNPQNSTTWNTTSDINIKTNIRPVNSSLDKIVALNPCHYEYKDKLGETRTGFIAQEFEQVLPGHVSDEPVQEKYKEFMGDAQTMKSISVELFPYLVGAIKELNAKITALEEQVLNLSVK